MYSYGSTPSHQNGKRDQERGAENCSTNGDHTRGSSLTFRYGAAAVFTCVRNWALARINTWELSWRLNVNSDILFRFRNRFSSHTLDLMIIRDFSVTRVDRGYSLKSRLLKHCVMSRRLSGQYMETRCWRTICFQQYLIKKSQLLNFPNMISYVSDIEMTSHSPWQS